MKKSVLTIAAMLIMSFCTGKNHHEIRAPGIVDGDVITLQATVTGEIKELGCREGQSVRSGQVLLAVDNEKIHNQIQELDIRRKEIEINIKKSRKNLTLIKAKREFLEKQVQRFMRLRERQAISGEKLEEMELKLLEAHTSYFNTQKTIEALEVQIEKIINKHKYFLMILNDHKIASPVDGVVIEKFVSAGETIFPGTPLFEILDTSSMTIEIFVEESELAGLKLNQKVYILVDGLNRKDLYGEISSFGRKAEFSPKYVISEKERKSLLYKVKITIKEGLETFKIGMPVTVVLPIEGH
jgi:HlyD family secretion protein